MLLVADERGTVYLKREAVGWDRDQMALSPGTIGIGRPITCLGRRDNYSGVLIAVQPRADKRN